MKQEDYEKFFNTLGLDLWLMATIMATYWGSRTVTPKQLLKALDKVKLNYISSGEPTYWTTHTRKAPDLIDFQIVKSIAELNIHTSSANKCLSSDQCAVEILLKRKCVLTPKWNTSPTT